MRRNMSYEITEKQIEILKYKNTLPIQKKPTDIQPKMHKVYHKGRIYLKSTNDQHKTIRIIMVAILTKIHIIHTSQNHKRLNSLKSIFYRTSLKHLVNNTISKQRLYSIIASELNNIQVGILCQNQIIDIFNTSQLFDQILINSITQTFQQNQMIINIQILEQWIRQKFNINLKWIEDNLFQQKQNQLFLKNIKGQILRYSYEQVINIDQNTSINQDLQQSKNTTENTSLRDNIPNLQQERKSLLSYKQIQFQIAQIKKDLRKKQNKYNSKAKKQGYFWKLICCDFD